jgi:uncharacterized protein YbjT (DUF2867 family)
MILVIGGRSKIGSALIAELVLKGEAVRVLARSGESVSSLPNGVKTVIGDLADRDSLRPGAGSAGNGANVGSNT